MTMFTGSAFRHEGVPIPDEITSGSEFTVTLMEGPGYLTLERKRNANGFYDTQPSNSLGTYASFTGIDESTSVTSPFISSVVVPQGGGSYTFSPTADVAISSSFLRSTGGVTLTIS